MLRQRLSVYLLPGWVGLALLVAGYIAFWIGENYRASYPLEYREGAMLAFTQLLVDGSNPYALEHRPVHLNVYGPGYHWAVLPLARIFGNTFQVHRAVSVGFIVATCLLLGWVLRWDKVSWPFAGVASLLLFIQLGQGLSIVARPDALGLFLFLASLFLPYRFGFATWSLAASLGLSLLAFLTKPYFVLGLALVPLYVFVHEGKGRGLVLGMAALLSLGLVGVVVGRAYECYFTETFFVSLNGATRKWRHLKNIGSGYLVLNFGLVAILLWALVARAWRSLRTRGSPGPGSDRRSRVDLFDLRKPLWNVRGNLPAFVLIGDGAALIGLLGLHQGNGVLYYHQLVTPFLLWLVFRQVDVGWGRPAWALVLLLVNLSWWSTCVPRRPGDYGKEWAALESLLASHTQVFNAPNLVHLILRQGKTLYDSGQTECYLLATRRNFTAIAPAYAERGLAYRRAVEDQIRGQQFDLIAVTPGLSFLLPLQELRKHYRLLDCLPAPMAFDAYPVDTFPIDVWVPKTQPNQPAP